MTLFMRASVQNAVYLALQRCHCAGVALSYGMGVKSTPDFPRDSMKISFPGFVILPLERRRSQLQNERRTSTGPVLFDDQAPVFNGPSAERSEREFRLRRWILLVPLFPKLVSDLASVWCSARYGLLLRFDNTLQRAVFWRPSQQ